MAGSGSEPERLQLRAGEIDFAALAWGPADGPLALCLHGYPDTARSWGRLGPVLSARGWRVVAPYLRGYPPSGRAPDRCYGIGPLARDAVALHAALGGDERAVLIGHDWGATAVYSVAADAACPFTRAVTLAIPPPRGLAATISLGNVPLLARQLTFSWYMLFQQLPVLSERALPALIPFLWRRWSPGYDGREDVADALASLSTPAARNAALGYYRALLPWRQDRGYAAETSRLRSRPQIPLLVLHGEQDGCVHPELARRAAAVLADHDTFRMVPAAGHFLQLEAPDRVGELIASFIE